jgi:hypothetical protein
MEGLQPRQLRTLFRWFKEGPPGAIPIEQDGRSLGLLQAVGWEDAGALGLMEELARWHAPDFADRAAARRWLTDEVLPTPDCVLFWVKDVRGQAVGHVGLAQLDVVSGIVTISDVLCGNPAAEALVAAAVDALAGWAHDSLRLRVRQDGEQPRIAA